MKNISLYTIKLTLSFVLSLGFFISCSEKDPELNIDTGPQGNPTEVLVKLLIKGEAILPPNTKQMSPDVEGSFQTDLQLLILKESGGLYRYECARPVEGSLDAGFSVKVPNSLDGSAIKFVLFANAKSIITDPDTQFKKDGAGILEDEIRNILVVTENQKWPSEKKIPMWAEDAFTFNIPQNGSPTPKLATLKLMRMLSRVDVGVNYDGNVLTSTATGLNNFILKEVKVYHTGNKGMLMPDPSNYTTTGTGHDKKIEINLPSLPVGDKIDITAYSDVLYDDQNPDAARKSCERKIYLFEQKILNGSSNFDVKRSCILVRGAYTPTGGQPREGWYRLDFRNFGTEIGYKDVLRNMLYRFNISKVSGPGFSSENDALESVSSNITVEMTPLELNQNDIIFDGQSYLSVNKSELTFYTNSSKSNISLDTNYEHGWSIDLDGVTDITADPMVGIKGSAVVEFSWGQAPADKESKTIYLRAGNLKKAIVLTHMNDNAPGDLSRFSLSPTVLYFSKDGGVGDVTVESNIVKKFLWPLLGKLDFSVPTMIENNSFRVTTRQFNGGVVANKVEKGSVEVRVQASNADITSQCEIKQLTYDKDLRCIPGVMEHGVGTDDGTAKIDVSYITSEDPGTYLIKFTPSSNVGNGFAPTPSDPKNGQGIIQLTAFPNKTSQEITVGKLSFLPAIEGTEIPLLGYTPQEFDIKQAPVPAPIVKINTSNQTFAWNESVHSFTVDVDTLAFVKNTNVAISIPQNPSIDMTMPSTGIVDVPVEFFINPNRTAVAKETVVTATVEGWAGQASSDITFRQTAPQSSTAPDSGKRIDLEWDATSSKLTLDGLNNIFDVAVIGKEAPTDGSTELPVNVTTGALFTMADNKQSASLDLSFGQNLSEVDRKVIIKAKATGNIASEFYSRDFTVSQRGRRVGSIQIIGDDPKLVAWNATRFTLNYTDRSIDATSLNVTTTASWVSSVSLDKSNKQIICVCSVNPNANSERRGEVILTGRDQEGVTRSARINLEQGRSLTGSITLNPQILNFVRNETRSKTSRIIKVNIPGLVRIESGVMPDWLSLAEIQGDQLVVSTKENLNHARSTTLHVFGADATGHERRASIDIKQESNIVRVSDRTVTSEYKYNEGGAGSSNLYPSFYISVESNSLPFTKFSAEPDSREHLSWFSAYVTKAGKSVEVDMIPTKRENSYDPVTIPITLNFETSQGVKSSSKLNVVRNGHPAPKLDVSGLPNTYPVIPLGGSRTLIGTVSSSNMKTTGNMWLDYPDAKFGQYATITQPNGQAVPNNYNGTVHIKIQNASNMFMNCRIYIKASGVDGKERLLKTIRYQ